MSYIACSKPSENKPHRKTKLSSVKIPSLLAWRRRSARLADKVFDLPPDLVTSWARLLLGCLAFAALAADRDAHAWGNKLVFVLLGYIAFSAVIVLTRSSRAMTRSGSYGVQAVDVCVSSALMVLSDGVASPFFVFYLFTLIAATLRWDWAGALTSAAILTSTLWLVHLIGFSPHTTPDTGTDELSRSAIRGGFLMIGGVMLAYLGASQERSRRRFARLANWPQVRPQSTRLELLENTLAHAARVTRAPRIMVIWDEVDEPYRHVAIWDKGKLQYSHEQNFMFGDLVAPTHSDRSFAVIAHGHVNADGRSERSPINQALTQAFSITSAATAAFQYSVCSGRVFVLDFIAAREEDISLVAVLASRIGVNFEDYILRERLQTAAASQERARLGRDLHDGVLQGLAAASIQLKVASVTAPEQTQQQIRLVREVLADEAQRIRSYVEATRAIAPAPTGLVLVERDLRKRVARLRELWDCHIELSIDPTDLKTSLTTARNIGHMITECVSNAVRHGRATRINVAIQRLTSGISMSVTDNGTGIEGLLGAYDTSVEAAGAHAPLSLKSRADELGGVLYLSSSSNGTNITVEFPT